MLNIYYEKAPSDFGSVTGPEVSLPSVDTVDLLLQHASPKVGDGKNGTPWSILKLIQVSLIASLCGT